MFVSARHLDPSVLTCHVGGTSCPHKLYRDQDQWCPVTHRQQVHTGPTHSLPNVIQSVLLCKTRLNWLLYLHADGQVNPGTKSSADSSGRQPNVLEQLGEGVREGEAGAFLCYHHAAPHT